MLKRPRAGSSSGGAAAPAAGTAAGSSGVGSGERRFDVVLLGASGFYGKRVAAELVRLSAEMGMHLRIALAGRSTERLAATRSEILDAAAAESSGSAAAAEPPGVGARPAGRLQEAAQELVLMGGQDAGDALAMQALAATTRVLLAAVPNFRAVGEGLVRACAEAGTHYIDLSIEPDLHAEWARRYGATAEATGALICHACGTDHVPADFGALLATRLFEPETDVAVQGIMVATPGQKVVLRESTFFGALDKLETPHVKPAGGGDSSRSSSGWPLLRWSKAVGRWLLPGPPTEGAVVAATRAHMARCPSPSPSPASYSSHIAAPSLGAAVAFASMGALFALSRFSLPRRAARALLPPLLRRAGVLTTDAARYEDFILKLRVRYVFVATAGGGGGTGGVSGEQRVLEIEGSGVPITASALALAAVVTLQQADSSQGLHTTGVATPAAAFHTTTFWEQLVRRAGLTVTSRTIEAA